MRNEQVLPRPNVDAETKPSPKPEQTDSQPSEDSVIEFKPTAKYQDPNDPGKVIDGNSLKTRVNLGTLASKFQSERDTAITRTQQLAQEMAKRDEQIAALQKRIAAREQEETTLATLKRLGLKPESQDTENSGSSWLTEEEKPQPTQQQILQELGSIKQGLKSEMSKELESLLARYNQENLQFQQSNQRVQSFVSRARQADEAQLRADMPDVPDEDITRIVTLHEAARALEMKAQEAMREGDENTAEEAYIQAQARSVEARNLQAKSFNMQQQLAAQKGIQQQTEMYAPGGTVWKELEDSKQKRSYNKDEAKKLAEEHIRKAKEYEKQLARLRSQ